MKIEKGSGEVNHLYTIKKWHVQQEGIQIAESITPTAHLMNTSPNRSINIFQTKMNQGHVTWPFGWRKGESEIFDDMDLDRYDKVKCSTIEGMLPKLTKMLEGEMVAMVLQYK